VNLEPCGKMTISLGYGNSALSNYSRGGKPPANTARNGADRQEHHLGVGLA
jgi:hypothetical protein